MSLDRESVQIVPPALRFGQVVGEGIIVGLITDYVAGKIQEHFKRSAFEDHLRDLQPEIEEEKERAIERSPPEIRQLIRHPVMDIFGGRSRQFYWVVQLRIRTKHATGTRFAISSTIPDLESVTISEKESSRVGSLHEGKSDVAPARHAVILREDSRTVIYSEPIVSWEVVYKGLGPRDMERAGRQFTRFTRNGQPAACRSFATPVFLSGEIPDFPKNPEEPPSARFILSAPSIYALFPYGWTASVTLEYLE